jgi:LPS export ABC transporter protein LptC/lipopolysaccharide transport protein LptA
MRLAQLKLSRSSIFISLITVVIFIEILVTSPQLLEKDTADVVDPAVSITAEKEDKSNSVEQKMQGFHLVENAEHEKGWELFGNEAVGRADGQWILKTVKVTFFSHNQPSYTVTGDQGEIDGKTKDMVIRGHATTTSANGYSFKTDTARYTAKDQLITSNDAVYMMGPSDNNGPGFQLTGEKLLVDMMKNKMSILDKIVARKNVSGKEFHLTSVRADFSNKDQEANFSGNVIMKLGTTLVKAPLASFQYSQTKKQIEKIVLSDKVEFTDADKKGFCQELIFELPENKMTMRGQPKVVQGEDEIKGHEIVFLEGGKKVKINKK